VDDFPLRSTASTAVLQMCSATKCNWNDTNLYIWTMRTDHEESKNRMSLTVPQRGEAQSVSPEVYNSTQLVPNTLILLGATTIICSNMKNYSGFKC
jgi:hypothetical protein